MMNTISGAAWGLTSMNVRPKENRLRQAASGEPILRRFLRGWTFMLLFLSNARASQQNHNLLLHSQLPQMHGKSPILAPRPAAILRAVQIDSSHYISCTLQSTSFIIHSNLMGCKIMLRKHILPVELAFISSSGPPAPFSTACPSHLLQMAPAKLALL